MEPLAGDLAKGDRAVRRLPILVNRQHVARLRACMLEQDSGRASKAPGGHLRSGELAATTATYMRPCGPPANWPVGPELRKQQPTTTRARGNIRKGCQVDYFTQMPWLTLNCCLVKEAPCEQGPFEPQKVMQRWKLPRTSFDRAEDHKLPPGIIYGSLVEQKVSSYECHGRGSTTRSKALRRTDMQPPWTRDDDNGPHEHF